MTGFKSTRTQHLYVRHPSGTYYARVYAFGKGKFICLHTQDFKQAQSKLPQVITESRALAHLKGNLSTDTKTMGDLMALYLVKLQNDVSKKPSTVTYRKLCVKVLKDSFEGIESMEPRRISLPMLLGWSRTASERYSGSLYNNSLGTLRELLNEAIRQGLCSVNLANQVKRTKVESKIPWLPSQAQFRQLVEEIRKGKHASAHGAADLIELMAYTGLRIGEATSLLWSDVDTEKNRIRVRKFKHSEERFIPIGTNLNQLLQFISQGRYFKNKLRVNHIISVSRCDDSLQHACDRLGFPRMNHHSCRHLFTTTALEQGIPVSTVAMLRGDKDKGAFLLKVYSHIRDDHLQDQIKKLHF
jgi:site-specific recombinase XerD